VAKLVKYQTVGRGSRGALLEPTQETLNGIEELLRWSQVEVPQRFPYYMHLLVQQMALVNQGYARKMSFGPHDPTGKDTSLAWRTPAEGIRRISSRYYLGWKVKQMGMQWWRLYNDSREAYFIEFGISEVGWGAARYVPARRIRRPVRKMSLRKTLEYMMRTHAYHRVWADIYSHPSKRHRGKGFTQIVQSPAKGSFRGPALGRYLP
jgi:hypothetical protein